MVMEPVRAAPLLGAATNCRRPLPLPLAPPVTVIQSTSLAAVQVHAPVTITSTLPFPPLALSTVDGGASTHVHVDGWLTVSGCPATVSWPLRAGDRFVAAVKGTWPGPVPEAVERVIQSAELVALHGQASPVVTV